MGKESNIFGEHLLHADAHAHAVDGAVYHQQLLSGGSVPVADHAGVVRDAEEAVKVLERGKTLPGA